MEKFTNDTEESCNIDKKLFCIVAKKKEINKIEELWKITDDTGQVM
jgi:hypothetical protein